MKLVLVDWEHLVVVLLWVTNPSCPCATKWENSTKVCVLIACLRSPQCYFSRSYESQFQ